jgi:protein SCO1/2
MIRCLLAALALWAWTALPVQAQFSQPSPNVGIDQHLNDQIPLELTFRDEQGKSVKLQDYFGDKPVILVLAYYRCPRLCSLVLNGLVEGLRQIDYDIGEHYTVVTVSIDPREQPELAAAKKAAYVQQYGRAGADKGWHFLTGEDPAIKRLADAVGYRYAYDPPRDQFAHGSGIMMLTPDGKLSRYFFGVNFSAKDLRFGLEDSSAGKIGSPVMRPLRLLCFTYDPVVGGYSIMTMRLVRIGGAFTILVLAVFLIRAWRRERRLGRQSSIAAGG